jgi:signal transduction histidine kinase/DNA-binding LacI/PurR family transcriptional regulator
VSQKNIALFVNNLDEEYQISVYKAVREEAFRRNYKLICIQSEPIFSGKNDPLTFYSAPWLAVDGVLILASLIGREVTEQEYQYIYQLFKSVPCVSIGRQLGPFPSVLTHTKSAFSELIHHLIDKHGYRKLLYIGGPPQNQDTIIRETVLHEIIQNYIKEAIAIDLTVEYGQFHEYSGMMIAQKYIQSKPSDPFDAVIAANDNMAIGVIKAIETSENNFWKQCAVTGFDDIPLAKLEYPPITTIHQPLDLLGKEALQLLDNLIEQKDIKINPPYVRYVESTIIIRQSCGCQPKKTSSQNVNHPYPALPQDFQNYTSIPTNILHQKQPQLHTGDLSSFLYLSIKSEQNMRNLSYLGQRLVTVNTYEGMARHLSDFLANLSVPLCYLFVFEKPIKEPSDVAYLVYKKNSSQEEYLTEKPQLLPIKEVLATVEDPVQCVYPLKAGDTYIGILIYNSYDYAQPHMCSCATFLSNNIQRLYELELEKKRTQILEEQVQIRTQELVRAYKELQEESRRREAVEAEVLRISEMERLRFSLDLHDDICQRLAGLSMYCKSMELKNPNLGEVVKMIDETLLLTRRYAHDAFPVELENLGLEKALEKLLRTLERQTKCSCTFNWDIDNSAINMAKDQEINIYRIVQEAVNNSIKHGRATRLGISTSINQNQFFCITISDNGHGNELLNQFPMNISAGGVGLRSMEHRTHQLQGKLSIQSHVNEGTIVSICIPLNKRD